jgi:hypothetical protein
MTPCDGGGWYASGQLRWRNAPSETRQWHVHPRTLKALYLNIWAGARVVRPCPPFKGMGRCIFEMMATIFEMEGTVCKTEGTVNN